MKSAKLISILFFIAILAVLLSASKYDILSAKLTNSQQSKNPETGQVIIDCNYTLNEALKGKNIPNKLKNNLRIIDVLYYSFDGKLHKGQLVISKNLVKDIKHIFKIIEKRQFPIAQVIPIVKYNWSDELSMEHNNTSAFNYRLVKGTKILSAHALGIAIDINPQLNPQIKHGKVFPKGAKYNPKKPGTITRDSFIVKEFLKMGWNWGGRWRSTKDYQHFEKR